MNRRPIIPKKTLALISQPGDPVEEQSISRESDFEVQQIWLQNFHRTGANIANKNIKICLPHEINCCQFKVQQKSNSSLGEKEGDPLEFIFNKRSCK